jgi:hypothetical protein
MWTGNKCFNQASTGVPGLLLCSKPYEQVQHIPDDNRLALACAEGDVKYDDWCLAWSKQHYHLDQLRAQPLGLIMSLGRLELYSTETRHPNAGVVLAGGVILCRMFGCVSSRKAPLLQREAFSCLLLQFIHNFIVSNSRHGRRR